MVWIWREFVPGMKSGSAYLASLLVLSHINGASVPFTGLHDMCGLSFSKLYCCFLPPLFRPPLFWRSTHGTLRLFLLCFFFFISLFSSLIKLGLQMGWFYSYWVGQGSHSLTNLLIKLRQPYNVNFLTNNAARLRKLLTKIIFYNNCVLF